MNKGEVCKKIEEALEEYKEKVGEESRFVYLCVAHDRALIQEIGLNSWKVFGKALCVNTSLSGVKRCVVCGTGIYAK